MKFTKMHGTGNDYVYVNCFEERVENPQMTAKYVSRPHFGIGSDGLILICPSETADCRMLMYNEDGSEGAMCGNGIRCVGKYVYEHGIVDKDVITVETKSGIKTLELRTEGGKVISVRVDMGEPKLTSSLPEKITVAGKELEFVGINMGNPHAVYYVDEVSKLDLEKLGPLFECHPRFPDRVNSEFVERIDRGHIKMRVWERGSGETLACGTGSCACAAASMLLGYVDDTVVVQLLGGELQIYWDRVGGHIFMSGPAKEVFHGEISLP